jgi:hypothetical protein
MVENPFMTGGKRAVRIAIEEKAKREIARIDASQLTENQKRERITEIKDKRYNELKKLNHSQILWGKR